MYCTMNISVGTAGLADFWSTQLDVMCLNIHICMSIAVWGLQFALAAQADTRGDEGTASVARRRRPRRDT